MCIHVYHPYRSHLKLQTPLFTKQSTNAKPQNVHAYIYIYICMYIIPINTFIPKHSYFYVSPSPHLYKPTPVNRFGFEYSEKKLKQFYYFYYIPCFFKFKEIPFISFAFILSSDETNNKRGNCHTYNNNTLPGITFMLSSKTRTFFINTTLISKS